MITKHTMTSLGLTFGLALAGCGETGTSKASNSPSSVTIPASIFVTTRPENALDLLSVKNTAKEGDEVVFLARVGGRAKPFAEGFAMFVVADPSLQSCELMGEVDHCPIPYDYCCEDPQKITAGIATIQIVDAKGTPLRTSLEGVGGLEGSKFLVVDGVVTEKNDEGLFTIDAREIWVGGKPNRSNPNQGSTQGVPHDHDGDGKPDH